MKTDLKFDDSKMNQLLSFEEPSISASGAVAVGELLALPEAVAVGACIVGVPADSLVPEMDVILRVVEGPAGLPSIEILDRDELVAIASLTSAPSTSASEIKVALHVVAGSRADDDQTLFLLHVSLIAAAFCAVAWEEGELAFGPESDFAIGLRLPSKSSLWIESFRAQVVDRFQLDWELRSYESSMWGSSWFIFEGTLKNLAGIAQTMIDDNLEAKRQGYLEIPVVNFHSLPPRSEWVLYEGGYPSEEGAGGESARSAIANSDRLVVRDESLAVTIKIFVGPRLACPANTVRLGSLCGDWRLLSAISFFEVPCRSAVKGCLLSLCISEGASASGFRVEALNGGEVIAGADCAAGSGAASIRLDLPESMDPCESEELGRYVVAGVAAALIGTRPDGRVDIPSPESSASFGIRFGIGEEAVLHELAVSFSKCRAEMEGVSLYLAPDLDDRCFIFLIFSGAVRQIERNARKAFMFSRLFRSQHERELDLKGLTELPERATWLLYNVEGPLS